MQEIIDNIDQRLAELRSEEQSLTEARKSLAASTPRAKPAKPAKRRARVSARTSKASSQVVPLGKLLKTIESNPGETTTGLARLTGGSQGALLTLLKEAEVDDKVRREGERRSTRWFVAEAA